MSKTEYDEFADEAQAHQSRHEPDEAIDLRLRALAIGGPRDRDLIWMNGVCYKMKGQYHQALREYFRALRENGRMSNYDLGRLMRDMSEAYSKLGFHATAKAGLELSLDLLPEDQYPAEHYMSLGFLARAVERSGDLKLGLNYYAKAQLGLERADNRNYELYNSLHYAAALSRDGRRMTSRKVALEARRLASIYGGRAHQVRAIGLFLMGHRFDDRFDPS